MNVLKRKRVVIDNEYESVPNMFILRCLRCGAGWQPGFDQDTKRVLKGYWHCIKGCHDKELGLKSTVIIHVAGAYDQQRTDWFYKNYEIDIDNWPTGPLPGMFMCWRCHAEGRDKAHYMFTDVHAIIDHVNAYHKKVKKIDLK